MSSVGRGNICMNSSTTVDVRSGQATYRGLRDVRGERFLGVRYAEPPLGELRFKPPVPLENSGLVDALRYRSAPPQAVRRAPAWAPQGDGFETGEDCLNLNLYTPVADDARRPVIVHAFGGGFQSGAAQGGFLDEAGFARDNDVVLVRPNMRVGALGFLHLADAFGPEYAAANRGMLDFIAAGPAISSAVSRQSPNCGSRPRYSSPTLGPPTIARCPSAATSLRWLR